MESRTKFCIIGLKKFFRELRIFVGHNFKIKWRLKGQFWLELAFPICLLISWIVVTTTTPIIVEQIDKDTKIKKYYYNDSFLFFLNEYNAQELIIIPLLCVNIGRFLIFQVAKEAD